MQATKLHNERCTFPHLSLDLALLPAGIDSTTHNTTAFLALDTACHTNVGVQNEPPDGVHPALVARKVVIELRSHVADGMKTGPWHGWEVVVLVVQTDIVCEPV